MMDIPTCVCKPISHRTAGTPGGQQDNFIFTGTSRTSGTGAGLSTLGALELLGAPWDPARADGAGKAERFASTLKEGMGRPGL